MKKYLIHYFQTFENYTSVLANSQKEAEDKIGKSLKSEDNCVSVELITENEEEVSS
jgi:hypothetical protein